MGEVAGKLAPDDPRVCKEHGTDYCPLCAKYEVTWERDGRKQIFEFYVGQNAGATWGPMGMEDYIAFKYMPGSDE